MEKTPLVSVIVTSYNQKELLQRALDSVLNQTYKNLEIILVDDCSGDGSKEFIKKTASDHPGLVRYHIQEKNVGIPVNKNTGFKMAKGDFITYLDGDDTYYPDKVKKEIEVFQKNSEAGIVYSNFDIKEFNGEVVKVWGNGKLPAGNIFKNIVLGLFPDGHLHRFEMFRKDVMHSLNFYDETFSIYHDLDFMLRYSSKYKVGYSEYIGSSYYKNPSSIVSSTKRYLLGEQRKDVFSKNKKLFLENGMEKELKEYLKNHAVGRLFHLQKFSIFPFVKAIFLKPLRIITILKAFNYNLKNKN